MFGYININKEELSDENKKIYSSYYCGLCQELGRQYGNRGRFLLTFDMTFLIVLLTGLYESESQTGEFTCAIHPIKKKQAIRNEVTEYAAAMNVILAYHKLLDDWVDDKNHGKRALAKILESDYVLASKRYPRQAKAVEEYMRKTADYEKSDEKNIDVIAGITGEMMGELLDYKQDEWSDELHTLGFYMGKFIYLMDAYEDLEKDKKNKQYNPLVELEKTNGENFETLCKLMLTSFMAECAKSFERLPILLHADILRNILYSGVWSKYEYLQLKKEKKKR